jgi:hypothetical protein
VEVVGAFALDAWSVTGLPANKNAEQALHGNHFVASASSFDNFVAIFKFMAEAKRRSTRHELQSQARRKSEVAKRVRRRRPDLVLPLKFVNLKVASIFRMPLFMRSGRKRFAGYHY